MSTKKHKRAGSRDHLVLNLLILVTLVIVIFEGNLILTMIRYRSASSSITVNDASSAAVSSDTLTNDDEMEPEEATSADTAVKNSNGLESTLAGLSDISTVSAVQTEAPAAQTLPTVSDPDSAAIVPEADTPVDDSYFSDAVFIGDSRMEGFRMASGITQGQFFTSVGMSLESMQSKEIIQTADGNVTVATALSGGTYHKIYLMLGTNDLGEYDWEVFREGFISVTQRFRELQPDAIFYICSVIYVEESKVTSGDYINNTNVDTINSILLDICEQEGYYYLDLNEILSNGYGSLIEGASSDGVHMETKYCKRILEYLKSHYIAE